MNKEMLTYCKFNYEHRVKLNIAIGDDVRIFYTWLALNAYHIHFIPRLLSTNYENPLHPTIEHFSKHPVEQYQYLLSATIMTANGAN